MPIVTPVFVPAVLAGLAFVIAWRMWRRRHLAPHGHWGGAVAFGLGFFAGRVLLADWPAFPPVRAADWHAWITVAFAVAGVLQRWWGARWYTAVPVRVLLSAALVVLVLRNLFEHTWGRSEGLVWLGGLTVALTVAWESVERLAAQRPGASLPLALWAVCALAAATFMTAGSALLGQLAGSLAAVCGAALVLAWWAPGLTLAGGAMTVFIPVYVGLILRGYFFGELPYGSAIAMAIAPAILWLGEQRRIRFTRPWKAALMRAAIAAVPMAIAWGLAYWLVAQQQPEGYYY